ncbi:MAG: DUF2335 domain-containing protein [Caldilineaceae bacterium]|nr:DUF2335 domain-containing protein [Caldilineaceae bacterium]
MGDIEDDPELRRSVSASLFTGPIPPPALMREYAELDPEFPRRFIEIFERQQSHDHEIEKALLSNNKEIILGNQGLLRRGQLFGFVLALVGLIGGLIASFLGSPIAGSIIGAGGLALLAGVFVYSKKDPSSSQFLSPVPQSPQTPEGDLGEPTK